MVNAANTSAALSTSNANAVYGEPVIEVVVSPVAPGAGVPTGEVEFTLNGSTKVRETLVNGKATLRHQNVGAYDIVAKYVGDGNFNESADSNHIVQIISQAGTGTTVTASSSSAVVGQSVTFTAKVAPVPPGGGAPTGTVTFIIDGTVVAQNVPVNASGEATYQADDLPVGSHVVQADYSGSTNFSASSGQLTNFNVNAAATTTSLTSSDNPSIENETVKFTAVVTPSAPGTGVPTGTVTFVIDNNPGVQVSLDANGRAEYEVALAAGTHTVTATYDGSTNYNTSSSATVSQSVLHAATAAVSSSQATTAFGEQVTFTATVTANNLLDGTPAGTVSFVVDNQTVATVPLSQVVPGQAQATYLTSALTAGSHTVSVVYNGNAAFHADTSDPITQTVTKANTQVQLGSSQGSPVYGQPVTFTATVTSMVAGGPAPTGTVTFTIDGVEQTPVTLNGSGVATLTVSNLSAASHTITAVYSGSSNYNTSTSGSLTQNVGQATTQTTLTSSALYTSNGRTGSFAGQAVKFTATVSPQAPGGGAVDNTVTFFVDGSPVATVAVDNTGKASFSTAGLGVGSHRVVAIYNGSQNFAGSESAVLTHVVAKTAVSVTVPTTVMSARAFTAVVEIKDPFGNRQTNYNGLVGIAINARNVPGTLRGTLTVRAQNGVARFTNLTLDRAGKYTLRATASGHAAVVTPIITVTASRLTATISTGGSVSTGVAFNVTLVARDATNNVDRGYTNLPATLQVLQAPAGGALRGTLRRTMVNGSVVFSGLSVTKSGTYLVRAVVGNIAYTFQIISRGRRA